MVKKQNLRGESLRGLMRCGPSSSLGIDLGLLAMAAQKP